MKIRNITLDERKDFHELDCYAFSEWPDKPLKEKDYAGILPEDTFGLFENGKILAGLRNHRRKQSVRGVLKNMSGIGCVCTYPEYRGKGYVRKLMSAAFMDSFENDLVVSMLAPFKVSFYAMFEYVSANSSMFITIPRSCFDQYITRNKSNSWQVDRLDHKKAREPFLKFMNEIAPGKHHGIVLFNNICDAEWESRFKKYKFIFITNNGETQALARYKIKGFMNSGAMTILDMYWRNIDARNQLFKFIAGHRDQITKVKMDLPFGFNYYQWIGDGMAELKIHVDITPWMVRIINVEKALSGLPVSVEGEINIKISDSHCEWNNGTYRIFAKTGVLHIAKTSAETHVKMNIQGITALVYGTMPVNEIIAKGWMNSLNKQTETLLNTWFPSKPMFNTYYF